MVEHNIVRLGSPNIVVLLAIGLAMMGLAVVFTVLMAAGGAAAFKRGLKSVMLASVMILPALAVVGAVGAYFRMEASPGNPQRHVHRTARKTTVNRHELVDHRSPSHEAIAEAILISHSDATHLVEAEDDSEWEGDEDNDPESKRNAEFCPNPPTPPTAPSADAAPVVVVAPINATINNQSTAVVINGTKLSRPSQGVLRVHETLPNEPDWAKTGPLPADPGILVPLSSQRFATIAEAEEQVTQLAVDYVKQFYKDEYPLKGEFTVPVSLVEKYAVKTLVGEELEKDFGNGLTGKMYRAHLRLDVNSKLRDALHESWNEQLVKQRLTTLGSGLGVVTVLLASVAGYFRLNEMTQGQYRNRLKLAAVALIGAAGLGVLALV
jgi:hypothetical protein